MKRLHSPWRSQYIATFKDEKPKKGESLFTALLRQKKDAKNLIVLRKDRCFVMMNLYPYNSGHLMVVPYRQTAELADLGTDELTDIMETLQQMQQVLTTMLKPHGFNIGANIGRVAGAGIDDHIHFHIVPRWNGDTNFMPTLADVKVVSEDMRSMYKKLVSAVKQQQKGR